MPISLKEIKEQLESLRPNYVSRSCADIQIDRILPMRTHVDTDASKTLYVGLASELPARCPPNVICIEDIPVSSKIKKQAFANLIIMPKATALDDLFCVLNNFIFESDRALVAAANFLASLAKARGLESVVNNAYTILGNPIIVSDNSWKALAITSCVKETDDIALNEFIKNGALSLETISIIFKEKLTDRIEQSETSFCCKVSTMKYPRLFCRVTIGSRIVATVSVVGYNRPFAARDYLLISMLANAISAEMQKNKFLHYTRGFLYEEFIVDLIEGRIKNHSVIEEKVKSLNLGLKRYIYVITVDIKEFDINCFFIPYLRDYLEKKSTAVRPSSITTS